MVQTIKSSPDITVGKLQALATITLNLPHQLAMMRLLAVYYYKLMMT